MDVEITYLYHSCFSVEADDKILLFDYPGREVSEAEERKLRSRIDGRELYVFVSHSHGDHFSSDITKFSGDAKKTHFILSDDVPLAGLSIDLDDVFKKVRPETNYSWGSLEVKTFESNDAGVAFLIELDGKNIYYGGDLAKWDWPEWGEKKRKEHVEVFDETLRHLREKDIDLAFSNMDERLSSWAGPIEFIEKVEPRYFVPIHTFGNEEWINDLVEKDFEARTEIFHYEKPGDEIVWSL